MPLGMQNDVIFTSEGGGRVDTGDGLVKRSQAGQVVGDDSQRGELHGDVPFVGCRPGGRPRETVQYSTVALRCQGEGRPVTRSDADTPAARLINGYGVRRRVLAQTYELLSEEVSAGSASMRSRGGRACRRRRSTGTGPACRVASRGVLNDWGRPAGARHRQLRRHLSVLAPQFADELRSARWAAVLPSILDAAEREPELAQLHAVLHARLMSPFAVVTERARGRERWRPAGRRGCGGLDRRAAFPRRWFSREHIDELFVRRVVQDAIDWKPSGQPENRPGTFAARRPRPLHVPARVTVETAAR